MAALTAVLVRHLQASMSPSDLRELISIAGAVDDICIFSNERQVSGLVVFHDVASASNACDFFDSYPLGGMFLEVQPVNAALPASIAQLFASADQLPAAAPGVPPTALLPDVAPAPPDAAAAAPLPPHMTNEEAPPAEPANGLPWEQLSLQDMEMPAGGADWLPDYSAPDEYYPSELVAGGATPGAPALPADADTAAGWKEVLTRADRSSAAAATASLADQEQQHHQGTARAGKQRAGGKKAPGNKQSSKAAEQEQVPNVGDPRCHLHIKHLLRGVSAEQITAVFSRFGEVTDAVALPDRQIGFVSFASAANAEKAKAALNGTKVPQLSGTKALGVNSRPAHLLQKYLGNKRDDDSQTPTKRLRVSYLARNTKQADFCSYMARFGEVTDVFIGGGENGGGKYAFCQYARLEQAIAAHKAINGKPVPVLAGPTRILICSFKECRH